MKPALSVIIPTFNRAVLVQQAVESVLQQRGDYKIEIIVVDDGSSADTEQGLRRFADAIRYVRQDNAGLNPARNHGLRLATGDYIALLDDDDIWLPFKTQLLLSALQAFPQAGFVHSNFFIWKPESDKRRPDGLSSWFPSPFAWNSIYEQHADIRCIDRDAWGFDQESITAYYGDLYYWSLFAPMVLPSTSIIRRSALEDGRKFPEVDSVGDWEFFARLSHDHGAAFVAHETTLNRSHEDAVRLTRVDPILRLKRRLGLIHRLWRQDQNFMHDRANEVDRVEAECFRSLAKLGIGARNGAVAREALVALRRINGRLGARDSLLWVLSRVTFAGVLLAAVRSLRARARRLIGSVE